MQLVFFILRRKFPSASVNYEGSSECQKSFTLDKPVSLQDSIDTESSKFCFLNVEKSFQKTEVDWSASGLSRLWGYNLHYFDYLRDDACDAKTGYSLIQHWVENNTQGGESSWEPFTTSLRIVNWIFFLAKNSECSDQEVQNSLYLQTLWLEKNSERHILANHYFENIKAWVFAGSFFKGKDADRWLQRGQKLLVEQLQEQILPDGGHYERSPHYHLLMLENYLDIYNLGLCNRDTLLLECVEAVKKSAISGLEFLHDVLMPDGTIPLFNDSVNTSYPCAEKIFEYAEQLGVYSQPDHTEETTLIQRESTGLYGYRCGNDLLLIDCGDIGPAYQPGHTHCDFLSYELMVDQQRVIVDAGVYEYSAGNMRSYVRSTKAHNTISVDKQEQSEIWGEFRVARRAKKIRAVLRRDESSITFDGAYRGFHTLENSIEHARLFSATQQPTETSPNVWIVEDILKETTSSNTAHEVESFVHFHPDFEITKIDSYCFGVTNSKGLSFKLSIVDGIEAEIADSLYCPDFSIKQANKMLVLRITDQLPVKLSYRLEKV